MNSFLNLNFKNLTVYALKGTFIYNLEDISCRFWKISVNSLDCKFILKNTGPNICNSPHICVGLLKQSVRKIAIHFLVVKRSVANLKAN